ncbi:hypothetical protein COV82_04900 [Candidatus Peregrinibacteria bacterium CG11_big_fil_rev_8_21_14_0_20_46_8]|nr:MAG: hypothetical protein COV82_04900 [Candidatus Peregrinibacteria bacterium CG11_big_fil_rev_8_21_14_0_20_46_8]
MSPEKSPSSAPEILPAAGMLESPATIEAADAMFDELGKAEVHHADMMLMKKRFEAVEQGNVTLESSFLEAEKVLHEPGFSSDVARVIHAAAHVKKREDREFAHDMAEAHTENFQIRTLGYALGRPATRAELPKFAPAFQKRLRGMHEAARIKSPIQKEAKRAEVRRAFILEVRKIAEVDVSEAAVNDQLIKRFARVDQAYTKVAYQESIAHKVIKSDAVLAKIKEKSAAHEGSMSDAVMSKMVSESIVESGDPELVRMWRRYERVYPPQSSQGTASTAELGRFAAESRNTSALAPQPLPPELQEEARAAGAEFRGSTVRFGGIARELNYLPKENIVVIRDPNAEDGGERSVAPNQLSHTLHNIVVDDRFTKMFRKYKPQESAVLTSHVKDDSLFIIADGLFETEEDQRLELSSKQNKLITNLVFVLTAPAGDSSVVGGGPGVAGFKERVGALRRLVQRPDIDKHRIREALRNFRDDATWADFVRHLEGR